MTCRAAAPKKKDVIFMLSWLSDNLVNIVLTAGIALVTGLLIRGMVRDRKAGKSACGGNCACCGTCRGCSGCCDRDGAAGCQEAAGQADGIR